MTITYRPNLCAGIFSMAFGAAVYLLVPYCVGVEYVESGAIDSRALPYAAGIVCFLLGVSLVVGSVALKRDTVRELVLARELKACCYMAGFLLYAWLFSIDFIASMTFLGFLTLAFCGSRKPLYYAITLAAAVVMHLLFVTVLNVRLATGGIDLLPL